jgi:acyl carrier protein
VSTPTAEAAVVDLVCRILGLGDRPVASVARLDTVEWDSLKHMEIIFALEVRYGVCFDEAEFSALDSTSAIVSALRRHRAT